MHHSVLDAEFDSFRWRSGRRHVALSAAGPICADPLPDPVSLRYGIGRRRRELAAAERAAPIVVPPRAAGARGVVKSNAAT